MYEDLEEMIPEIAISDPNTVKNLHVHHLSRVPTQVLQSLIKSYICFALQSLFWGGYFCRKSLIFDRKEDFRNREIWFPILNLDYTNQSLMIIFSNLQFLRLIPADLWTQESNFVSALAGPFLFYSYLFKSSYRQKGLIFIPQNAWAPCQSDVNFEHCDMICHFAHP